MSERARACVCVCGCGYMPNADSVRGPCLDRAWTDPEPPPFEAMSGKYCTVSAVCEPRLPSFLPLGRSSSTPTLGSPVVEVCSTPMYRTVPFPLPITLTLAPMMMALSASVLFFLARLGCPSLALVPSDVSSSSMLQCT